MTSAEFTKALWYLSRSTGTVAIVILSLSIVLGIVSRSGRGVLGVGRFGVSELHQTLALTGAGLITTHVVTLLFDPYAQLQLVDLVFPFRGAYRTFWLGLGTTAVDLLIVVIVVSLLRQRVGPRVFRNVHWAVYALWPLALAHGLGTGTDNGTPWMLYTTGACVVMVGAALLWRLTDSHAERGTERIARRVVR